MTEAEWLPCDDPHEMLDFLRGNASERKLRLFACGCCLHYVDFPNDLTLQQAVASMEQFAEGLLNEHTRPRFNTFAHHSLICELGASPAIAAAYGTASRLYQYDVPMCSLLRDIFGNPFRPVAFFPEWRTSTVMALAQGIYDERAFDRMPILADALQDAGCDNADILDHCRDEKQPHVRGCWVVDHVLGKE